MKSIPLSRFNATGQLIISLSVVILISAICFATQNITGYRVVALLLLATVSILAMLFEMMPVIVSSILSAIIWNFFFIPPKFTFSIHNAEDILMFSMYFVIAMVNAVLTSRIKKTETIKREKEEKEKTIKLYDTLFSSLSHELRTPISTIVGAVDNLKFYDGQMESSTRTELLVQIDEASMRLNRQVENLLNMSRLETGLLKPNKEWCDINDLVDLVIEKTVSAFPAKLFEWHPDESLPLIKTDSGMLEQILKNILSNAALYTPVDALVTVDFEVEDEQLILRVADNGPGVPTEALSMLFDKFFRANGSHTGGTGLGLSIAKGFTDALGGSIKASPVEPHGLCISIHLPVETTYINHLHHG